MSTWTDWAVLVAVAAGALSVCAGLVILVGVSRRIEKVSKDQKGLRRQMSNIISMLLRAGYKRGPTVDWSDDDQKTLVKGRWQDTIWDWRRK